MARIDRVKEARAWLKHHCGKDWAAPLTGQDHRAFDAYALLLDLYCVSDDAGRDYALKGLQACVLAAQPSVRPYFKRLIPWALDWSDEEKLWGKVLLEPAVRVLELVR